MCHIAQPAEGKIHVYFHTSVNPEKTLSQVIICSVYLPLYAGSMAFWLLISQVYTLCELKCLLDPFLYIVQVLKTPSVGWTTVGERAQPRGLEDKVQISFATYCSGCIQHHERKPNINIS